MSKVPGSLLGFGSRIPGPIWAAAFALEYQRQRQVLNRPVSVSADYATEFARGAEEAGMKFFADEVAAKEAYDKMYGTG